MGHNFRHHLVRLLAGCNLLGLVNISYYLQLASSSQRFSEYF